jgi:hypothetical protein
MTYACPAHEFSADIHLLKFQHLWNKVLRTNGKFPILNTRKSCALSFHPRQRKIVCKPIILYNGAEIPYKLDVKFLGINKTENLIWHTHIKSVCSSLSRTYFIIKTLKEAMSYNMIRSVYYSYFQSGLKYGIILGGSANDSIKVFLIQKR